MKSTLRLSIVLALVSVLSWAQSPNATVAGRVLDPSNAVVSDAKVDIINLYTNIHHTGQTNHEGSFVIPNLAPGPYRIEVSKSGFKTAVREDVVLRVQDVVALNFTLPIGSVTESVTVTGGAPLVNAQDAAVSTVVDRQFAENLPMNGRSFQTLIDLTPGVVLTVSSPADSGQFSINGQRAASNYWMVDGVSANVGVTSNFIGGNGFGGTLGASSAFGGTNSLVSVDALQEFRIQTSTYAPEFGRTPGGQISIVTRSGTNQWHGTVFDYFRNDVLDANDWFADSAGLRKPKERQNDFGGTFSGPILKDKMFFFFSYEGLRLRLPQTALTTVPCDSTCTVFGDARAMATAGMQPFLNAFPLPNGPEGFDPCDPSTDPTCPPTGLRPRGSADFNASYSDPATLDAYSIRIDHRLNSMLTLFGRYDYSPSEFANRGGSTGTFALSAIQASRITTQTATVGATWLMNPRVTNDLRFNYSRANAKGNFSLDSFGGAVSLTALPLPSPFTDRNAAFALGVQSLRVGNNLEVGRQAQNLQRQINIVDSLSVQKGSHSLKIGVDFRRLSPMTAPPLYGQVVFFLDVPSFETGNSALGELISSANPTLLFHNLGVFAQDAWRVTPRLNLTYGLRWDVDFVPSSLNGPSIPAVTGYNLNDFSHLAIAPAGTTPFKTTYGNVAPRIGAAYQLSQSQEWQTVLRGGFGIFYDLVSSETGNVLSSFAPPFAAFNRSLSGTFPYTPAQIAPPPIPPTGSISQLFAYNPNLKLPYTLEWNIALEQGLGTQQTLSASYVGAAGRRLLQTTFVSNPPTNLILSGNLVDNTATSDYNALQLQFQRRLSRGLQAIASYTWSHSIDTGSAGSNAFASNRGAPGSHDNGNRGPSDFDIRNAFSAGVTYDIPAPKMNALANAILRGWSTENIIQVRSAPPVDISDINFFQFNNGIQADIRPDLVPGQSLYLFGPQYRGGKAFNPAAFKDPPTSPAGCDPAVDFPCDPARQGSLGRNRLRGFGATQWDFAVHRNFHIHESLNLQFRAEMFNVLNHPNFGQPSGAFGTGGFGVSSQMLGRSLAGGNLGGGAFSPLYQIGGPRSIQFALKLMF